MTSRNPATDEPNRPTRRRVIAGSSGALIAALAGCLNTGDEERADGERTDDTDGTPTSPDATEEEGVPQTPQVTDPPDAVYLPTHREAMVHLDPVETGPYTVGPMVTYPHAFWLVTGTEVEEVRPQAMGVHLMFSVWDSETGAVLPVDVGAEMRVLRDGEVVDTRSPWPMISQTMGFHFGDNVPLAEQGTYTVEVDLNPITIRRTGAFDGRFEERQTAAFGFEFDQEFQREVVGGVEFLDEERWGEPGALEPMGGMGDGEDVHDNGSTDDSAEDAHTGDSDMNGHDDGSDMDGHDDSDMDDHGSHAMPFSALPPADEYPGDSLGEPTSGDATFVVRYLEETRLSDDGYLLVSPRTPYNRVPLADMALSVSGGIEGELVQTLDSEVGHHYGLSGTLSPRETVEIIVESPPQVSRHQGYETGFIEMPSMSVEVPE